MASLTIRNLPDTVRDRIRIRAAVAGRSMEAEARAILAAACGDASEPHDASSLQTWVDHLYGSKKPRDTATELIRERRREAKKK